VPVTAEIEYNEVTVVLTPNDIDNIIHHATETDNVITLNFTGEAFADTTTVTVPAALFDAAAHADVMLELALPQGTLAFAPATLASAAQQAAGTPITLMLEQLPVANIPTNQRRYVGDNDYAFHISLLAGNYAIRHFEGSVYVTVYFSGRFPATVWFLDDAGMLHPRHAASNEAAGTVTFATPHFSLFIIQEAPIARANPFVDVRADAIYFPAVQFVNEQGLFMGTAADHFSPHQTMTRGMMTTILWRLAGEPDMQGHPNPFADVATGRFYTSSIIWAAQHGIVLGTGNNIFQPYDTITLRQAITMLNRYAERFGLHPFAPPGQYRHAATRAEIAMLLYNLIS